VGEGQMIAHGNQSIQVGLGGRDLMIQVQDGDRGLIFAQMFRFASFYRIPVIFERHFSFVYVPRFSFNHDLYTRDVNDT